jgi:hypothetical protein
MDLSFLHATGPCQRSVSRVRVPCDSRPYFIVSDLRLPFSSPPTTHRVTVEVFDPASTRVLCPTRDSQNYSHYIASGRTQQKTRFPNNSSIVIEVCLPRRCIETAVLLPLPACSFRVNLFTEPLRSNELFRHLGVMSQY